MSGKQDCYCLLRLTRREHMLLLRLLGNHVSGVGLEMVYNDLANHDQNKGDSPEARQPLPRCPESLYGDRPMIRADFPEET